MGKWIILRLNCTFSFSKRRNQTCTFAARKISPDTEPNHGKLT